MSERDRADITGYSFEKFIEFLFDRDVPPESAESDSWFWHVDVEFDPEETCQHYIRLFTQPEFLSSHFSSAQLDQGFWAVMGRNLDCSAGNLIWHEELLFQRREECVRSMYFLFKRLFAVQSLDSAVQMWWDALCYDWHCGNKAREKGGEDLRMQDVMFETLSRILELDSVHCQDAALHGLGHLHHPLTPTVIGQFLENHPDLTKEQRDYALAAMEFKVL